MRETKNVPQVRFSAFDDEWEEKKLGEIVTEVKRKADSNSTAPVMMISATQGFINQSEKYSADNAGSSLKNYTLLKKGELSYNHGYSKTRNFGSCFTLEIDEARIPFVYHSFSLDSDDSSFFGKYLNSGLFDKELKKRVASTARMDGLLNISFDEYVSLIVKKPTLAEQQKIGTFLSHVDSLIQAKTKKLESLKSVKKSLLQKCFPKDGEKVPQMRFEGFSGDWEEKKLGEICEITMGQSPDGSTYSDKPNTYILVQGNADMKDGFVCPRVWTTQKTKYAYKGDLIFSVRAPVGEVGKTDFDVVIGRGVASIKGNEFIFQYLKKMNEFGYWDSISCGSTFESINSDGLKNALVKIPSIEEQQKIGQFFSKYDSLISAQQKEIDKLKDIKKSLLQKMFV